MPRTTTPPTASCTASHTASLTALITALLAAAVTATVLVAPAQAATRQTARLTLSDRTVHTGDAVGAVATFTPVRRGREVLLQQRTTAGWLTVKRSAQDRAGRARFAVYAGAGSRVYRAVTLARGTLPTRKTKAVRLRVTGAGTVRVSQKGSYYGAVRPDISADGRLTAYTEERSDEDDIEPGVYTWDRATGVRTAIGSGQPGTARISADGRVVAWTVGGFGIPEAWVWDRTTRRATAVPGSGYSYPATDWLKTYAPAVSGDGRYVVYGEQRIEDERLVQERVVLWDRATGTTRDVVRATVDGTRDDPATMEPHISADGRLVAVDRVGGRPLLWSTVSEAPVTLPSSVAWIEDLSEDGRYLAYGSGPGETPSLLDRRTGQGTRVRFTGAYRNWRAVSVTDLAGAGRHVVVTGTTGTTGRTAVFVLDRRTQTTTRASLTWRENAPNASARRGVASADGRFVAFESKASDLVPGADDRWHEPDVYLRVVR